MIASIIFYYSPVSLPVRVFSARQEEEQNHSRGFTPKFGDSRSHVKVATFILSLSQQLESDKQGTEQRGTMEQEDRIRLEANWKKVLHDEFTKPYMQGLRKFLLNEKRQRKVIYPPGDEIFAAFAHTPFNKVRVVIIGQDPYHGPGQAHGLCFSVRPGVAIPPSLQNIFKELKEDLGIDPPEHGCLTAWAEQGVLLLNAVLSVQSGMAASHRGRGWEEFTDKVIEKLNDADQRIIFLLWGSDAQKKGRLIDRSRHIVLSAPHPSPLSAHRGFFGCRHFSRVNEILRSWGEAEIDWRPTQLPGKT